MPSHLPANLEQCGRLITSDEINGIISTVKTFPHLSRNELSETICEHLLWFTATGRYKRDACLKLLQKLESAGHIALPPKRKKGPRCGALSKHKVSLPVSKENQPEITCDIQEIKPVTVEPVTSKAEVELWNEHIAQYHYLGYKRPIGCSLRYFVRSDNGNILACLLFAGAAKSITVRDKWIGWSNQQRLRNLPWVVNNSRFVVLPHVKVACLASHILGQIGRRIASDWQTRWGYSPLLMETFVDPQKYQGTCYQASNWKGLGRTTGEGLVRQGKSYTTTPKLIFVKPLAKNFRQQLCSEYLKGNDDEL